MDDDTDWTKVDADWVALNRPDKLSEAHLDQLTAKYGDRTGSEKYQNAILRHLRSVRILPPYKGGR